MAQQHNYCCPVQSIQASRFVASHWACRLPGRLQLFTPKVYICKKYISVHDILDFCPSVIEGKSGAASVSAEMQDHPKVH